MTSAPSWRLFIYLAKKHPYVTVYAVEPDLQNYRNLKRNIELNEVRNVVPIRAAITEHGGMAPLYAHPFYSRDNVASSDCRGLLDRPLDKSPFPDAR